GIPLYLAQALSVALYTIGFAESVVGAFPMLNITLVGIITTVAVAVLALVSAKAAIRAQYFIMFGIILSLLSLYFGSPVEQSNIEMRSEEHTSELQSRFDLVCRLLLEKK